jgi:hypothetical protein
MRGFNGFRVSGHLIAAIVATSTMIFGSDAMAKTVALVDNTFNDNFLNCGEGWVRATGVADANIQIGGNFTTGLGNLANDDALIIVAHSTGPGDFVWGGTAYTAFGAGAGEMAVPAGFANLKNITVNYVTCFSATAPSGGSSILSKLLTAMGGAGNSDTGTGFVGTAEAHVASNMSNGTAAQYTKAAACLAAGGDPWMKNPPANRPNTGGSMQPANQRSAGQALVNNCNGVPPDTVTFNIPNRVGVVGTKTGYPPPSDNGAFSAESASEEFTVNGIAVCGSGSNSHVADDMPTAVMPTSWGRLKTTYR